jgi:magnesium transporter
VAHFGVVRHSSGPLEQGLEAHQIAEARVRRSLGPLREVLSNLVSGVPYVDEGCLPFFLDVHDHVLRLLDELETKRGVLAGLLESYLSQISNRMNAVMKRLTALAMIGLPFTVISGYFGMNFEVIRWLKQPWGIAAATILMLAFSTGASVLLKSRDWL